MQSPLGGINASEDADSQPTALDPHMREGAFYVFTLAEFQRILSEKELAVCAKYFNVQPHGNVDRRFDHQGELVGQNTLCVASTPPALAAELRLPEAEIQTLLASGKRKLLHYRDTHRPRPALDDKI
ncbi:hypothetical protein LTR53_019772, partial [Teratosphaeriaceae sp. CCFEE 6253]